MNLKKITMLAGLSILSSQTYAANWLMLQGTEPTGQAPRAKLWGFVQPEYQSTSGTDLKGGPFEGQTAVFNQIRPDNKTDNSFNIRRARIGVRGTGFPLDPKVNYFLLTELGNNGITKFGGGGVHVTDASITLNHIPGARIRAGLFKTPGSEEGLQAIHVFNYVNFTSGTDALLLERFTKGDGSTGADGGNGQIQSVGAFRDQGIQVFDTFKVNNWEHSYAVMYGNGNGINSSDNNDDKDTHVYWSSELVYGGKGGRRQGLKLFAWAQSGTRTLTGAGAGDYDRDRNGLGVTFLKGKYRAAAEYITADGMIFSGSDGGALPGSVPVPASGNNGDIASLNVETDGEADSYYVDFGYKIIPDLELDFRYDVFNRNTHSTGKERKFDTVTLGAQYFLNKKSRITFNYELRNLEAPNAPGAAPPNQIGDSIDDRLSLQLLTIF